MKLLLDTDVHALRPRSGDDILRNQIFGFGSIEREVSRFVLRLIAD